MCPYCECIDLIIKTDSIREYKCGYKIDLSTSKELNSCSNALQIIMYLKDQIQLLTRQLRVAQTKRLPQCQDFNPN